jgi:hypothetical protein
MTHTEFNHLLSQIKALPPEQMRQLRQQLDHQLAQPKKPTAPTPGKATKRSRPAPAPAKARSIEELHRKMMARGLIIRLPDPSLDIDDDDPENQPIAIKGEPLSETIIRERR